MEIRFDVDVIPLLHWPAVSTQIEVAIEQLKKPVSTGLGW